MSGITCQECFNAEATMYFNTVEVCDDCYHTKSNEVESVSKPIVINYFLHDKQYAQRIGSDHIPRSHDLIRFNNTVYVITSVCWIEDEPRPTVHIEMDTHI